MHDPFHNGWCSKRKMPLCTGAALRSLPAGVHSATAKHDKNDEEFSDRIKRPQADRDQQWTTIEEPLQPSQHEEAGQTVVIDCVTLGLSAPFSRYKCDINPSPSHLKKEIGDLKQTDAHFFISNELGMGLHAETEIVRKFTDQQGWATQYIAQEADEQIFMISGLLLTLKTAQQ